MSSCYKTLFVPQPFATSPVYTNDPAKINQFVADAETCWNWLFNKFKDDDTDKNTFKHFLKELNDSCKGIQSWSTADKPYKAGAIVINNGRPWLSKIPNNNNEPNLQEEYNNDSWLLMGDLQKVAILGCVSVDVATVAELERAVEKANHKTLLCDFTINFTGASYTISKPLSFHGTGNRGFKIILKGNNANITCNSGNGQPIVSSEFANVKIDKLTLKGDGSNHGVVAGTAGLIEADSSLTVRDCAIGINAKDGGAIKANGALVRDCTKGINATSASNVSVDNGVITNNTQGIRCNANASISAKGAKITGGDYPIISSSGGIVDFENGDMSGFNKFGIYSFTNGNVFARKAKIDGGQISIYCTNFGNVYAYQGELKNGSSKAVSCDRNSNVNMEVSSGNGTVDINRMGQVYTLNSTGFTFGQARNTLNNKGCIHN